MCRERGPYYGVCIPGELEQGHRGKPAMRLRDCGMDCTAATREGIHASPVATVLSDQIDRHPLPPRRRCQPCCQVRETLA